MRARGRDTGDRCTGCGWAAPNTPWGQIEVMEVVNGGVIEGRTAGMPFWYARLNEGHRYHRHRRQRRTVEPVDLDREEFDRVHILAR